MSAKKALVVGATGAVATRLVELMVDRSDWTVIGVCRNPPRNRDGVEYISVDLLDSADCGRKILSLGGVTHVFYAARAKHGEGGSESVPENLAMLRNVLDTVEPSSPDLRHVHLVEGGKYYGVHLGPYPTPAREDDSRHSYPNFYYDQEDLLVERQHGKRWTWSASRPNVVCDFSPQRARNLVSILGAYGVLCRELGHRLDFPGRPGAYAALTEVTDATHLARAMFWMATDPRAANQAFNVSNGDVFRWNRLWPRLAAYFGVAVGDIRPLALADWARDKGPVWQRIVERHGLRSGPLDSMAVWGFADFVFRQDYDVISSTTKIRRAGFHDIVDSEDMILSQLDLYRAARLLP